MPLIMPPGAKRISSSATGFYKRAFTPLWICLLILTLVILVSADQRAPGIPLVVFLVPVLMMVLGYFLFRKLFAGLMDEVWDNGDELIVVNDGHAEHVPFIDIINVNYSGLTNPKRVTLSLRHAGRLGERIAFIPAISLFWPMNLTTAPLVEDLIKRADAARQKS
ncbi:MAG TPA: hypothetical protein VGM16_06725 [Gammaproteobacteria bacterium]|jgi:hypothetical protein